MEEEEDGYGRPKRPSKKASDIYTSVNTTSPSASRTEAVNDTRDWGPTVSRTGESRGNQTYIDDIVFKL
jgi:hypothetical protein